MAFNDFIKETDDISTDKPTTAQKDSDFSNWYSGSKDDSRLTMAMNKGAETAPDLSARVRKMQMKTGLPEDMISRNLDTVEAESRKADFDPARFRKESPIVAQWMSESPQNSSLVHDDVDNIRAHEKAIGEHGFFDTMYRSLNNGLSNLGAQATRVPALVSDLSNLRNNLILKAVGHPELQVRSPAILSENSATRFFEDRAQKFTVPELQQSITQHLHDGEFRKAGRTLAAQFMANAPTQAAIIIAGLTGAGVPALVGAGALQASSVAEEGRKKGFDPAMSTVNAVVQGTVEAGFESIGTFGILKHWEGVIAKEFGKNTSREVMKDFAKTMFATGLGEGNEEFLTQLAQDFSDYITGANPDALTGTFQRAADAGLIGAASGVATTTPSAMASGIIRSQNERRVNRAKDLYNALGATAEASKLRERLPEAHKELVERMTKDGPVENIYVPASTIQEYFQSKNEDPAPLMSKVGALDSFLEAKNNGGDVRIPMAEWVNKVVGTEYYQAFQDDFKFSPTDQSVNDVKQAKELVAKEEAARQAEVQAEQPQMDSAVELANTVAEKLKSAGFDESTAGTYSKIYESAFRTLGEKAGVDPKALFERYGLQINRTELQTANQGQTQAFNQEAAPEPLPIYSDEPKTGDPVAVFNFNWRLAEGMEATPYFRVFGDPAIINDKLQSGWRSDVPYKKIIEAGIPIVGKMQSATEEPNLPPQTEQQPNQQTLQSQEGTTGANAGLRDNVFPVDSSTESIASEPDFIKLRTDAAEIVDQYAKQRGIEPSQQFAKTLWQEMHDALGDVRRASPSERMAVAQQVMQKYPNIEQDFVTLKDALQVMKDTDEERPTFNLFVKDKYQARHEEAYYQPAYHGTPHTFSEFSLKGIGTGEGAQAYGWGLYFAGNREVAEAYRTSLSPRGFKIDGKKLSEDSPIGYLLAEVMYGKRDRREILNPTVIDHTDIEKAIRETQRRDDAYVDKKSQIEFLKTLEGKKFSEYRGGNVYEVDIPEDNEYLDWDKPLGGQEKVEKAFPPNEIRPLIKRWEKATGNKWGDVDSRNFYEQSGKELYATLYDIFKSQEKASKYLNEKGIPGIKYLDEGSRGVYNSYHGSVIGKEDGWWVRGPHTDIGPFESKEESDAKQNELNKEHGTSNYVIFDDKLIKMAQRYEQSQQGKARGQIRFGTDRQFNIDLLKDADLSTFLHETGHFYLEVLTDLSKDPNANQQLKDDFEEAKKFIGVGEDGKITREHHEKWARAFEAYLLEGKAPSSQLRQAFSRFRAWLVSIYQRIQNLNVELTPEVRGVFDRLLASDVEIKAAEKEQSISPMFANPAEFGLTDKEAASYNKAVQEAHSAAEEELASQLMADVQRTKTKAWNDTRDAIIEEITPAVNARKEYIALEVLQSKEDTVGEFGMKTFKLDKAALVNDFKYTPADLKSLPKPVVYTAEGGVHPALAAEMFGFRSAEELLFALRTSPKKQDFINQVADEQMKELHGDTMTDGSMPVKAMRAIHNNKRSELLRRELQHLASENLATLKGIVRRVAKRIPTIEAVRAQAQEIVAQKKVRDIQPVIYQRAESKARNQALELLLKGEIDQAFIAKQRELLNHELYKAADEARQETENVVDYMAKFSKASTRERIGQAGADYLDQIDVILDRYDFRKGQTNKAIDRKKSLVQWVADQRAAGYDVTIPDNILFEAQRQSYKELPYEQMIGVRDSVKNIEHLARVKNQLLENEKHRELVAAREELIASLAANHDLKAEPHDFAPSLGKKLLKDVKRAISSHTRMEFLFEYMDGGKPHGTAWETFFKPVAQAEDVETKMMRESTQKITEIFDAYTKKERAFWFYKKTLIPEINASLTKGNIMAVALNWGNEYNRQALMDGYKWSETQVQAILNTLEERDWKTVQAVWDHIDSFWPQAQALERSINGTAPEKVEASEVQTKFGTFKGGYYPIAFDADQSYRQAQLDERSSVSELFGGNWARAMTRHGHLEARVGTGGKPLLLNLSPMTTHIMNVVHDISHRKAVIDLSKLINDPQIREAVEAAVGKEMYRELNPWIVSIAGDRRQEPFGFVEKIASRARMGATTVNLGWKVSSAAVQVLGYTISAKELGPKYASVGIQSIMGPKKITESWGFITERSEMMRNRMTSYDRDVRDASKRLNITADTASPLAVVDTYTADLTRSYFKFVGFMDLATSVPTWMGAYQKAMDGGLENIAKGDEKSAVDYADSVVRKTQSAGGAKDLASIQRGSELHKLFTMFYSQLSLIFNQFQSVYQQFRIDRNIPNLIGASALIWFIPAILEDVLRGQAPGGDDDKEKWIKWLSKKEVFYPFQSVVLVRDLVSAMDYDYSMSPAANAIGSLSKSVKAVGNRAFGDKEEFTKSDFKNMFNTVGYFAALPTRQTWQTLEYAYEWMTGEQQPSNPAEGVWRMFLAGKKR